jgi:hypothetical protein
VVLDDVWRASELQPFLSLGDVAQILVTRDRSLLPVGSQVIVDVISQKQASGLLMAGLAPVRLSLVNEITTITGRWPLLLIAMSAGR